MKTLYFIALFLVPSLVLAEPALGEAPASADLMYESNVERLLLTNGCAYCDLTGVDLQEAHLIGADLRGAQLVDANLSDANLEGADLTGANLTGANLTGAFLTNSSMVMADLDGVNFSHAQLYHVDVTGASMENLNLANATVVETAIGVGGGMDMINGEIMPILDPADVWDLPLPPSISPSDAGNEVFPSDELLDVPTLSEPRV